MGVIPFLIFCQSQQGTRGSQRLGSQRLNFGAEVTPIARIEEKGLTSRGCQDFQSAQPFTNQPSNRATAQPSNRATEQPSNRATKQPTNQPTNQPTKQASKQPSDQASKQPTNQPANKCQENSAGATTFEAATYPLATLLTTTRPSGDKTPPGPSKCFGSCLFGLQMGASCRRGLQTWIFVVLLVSHSNLQTFKKGYLPQRTQPNAIMAFTSVEHTGQRPCGPLLTNAFLITSAVRRPAIVVNSPATDRSARFTHAALDSCSLLLVDSIWGIEPQHLQAA